MFRQLVSHDVALVVLTSGPQLFGSLFACVFVPLDHCNDHCALVVLLLCCECTLPGVQVVCGACSLSLHQVHSFSAARPAGWRVLHAAGSLQRVFVCLGDIVAPLSLRGLFVRSSGISLLLSCLQVHIFRQVAVSTAFHSVSADLK